MRFISKMIQNILRWIYMIAIVALGISMVYGIEDKRKGLIVLGIALLMPFLVQILGRIGLKLRAITHLFQKRGKRKSVSVLSLCITGFLLFLFFYFGRKTPVVFYGGWKERIQIVWNQLRSFSSLIKYLWMYWIFFAAFATVKKLKHILDYHAAILLGMTDAFFLFGMLSNYKKIGYYGFFLFSVLLVLSYFRLLVKETYGETILSEKPKNTSTSILSKKSKKKKPKKKRKKNKKEKRPGRTTKSRSDDRRQKQESKPPKRREESGRENIRKEEPRKEKIQREEARRENTRKEESKRERIPEDKAQYQESVNENMWEMLPEEEYWNEEDRNEENKEPDDFSEEDEITEKVMKKMEEILRNNS